MEHRGDDLGQDAAEVVDVKVEPAVVVVIPKPAGETERRTGDAQFRGDVFEGAVPFVVIKPALTAHVGDEKVEPAVAVVIAPGGAFGEAVVADSGGVGDVLEGAVAFIMVKPATSAGRAEPRSRAETG